MHIGVGSAVESHPHGPEQRQAGQAQQVSAICTVACDQTVPTTRTPMTSSMSNIGRHSYKVQSSEARQDVG